MEETELAGKMHAPASALTLEERKRLELARGLATRPRLLLLDEVVAGLNPEEGSTLMALLTRLHQERAMAIVIIEHIMDVVMGISDRVVVLHEGRVIAEGSPQAVATDPAVLEAYLAVQALVERYDLDAVTVREWPELSRHGFSLSLACSRLGDEGIPCIQEADLPSTVLALALNRISSQPIVLGELVHVNPDKDVAIFAHEGALPLSMADDAENVVLDYADFSFELFHDEKGGVSLRATLKPGHVTTARLSGRPVADRLRMAFVEGEVLESKYPPPEAVANGPMRFEVPAGQLVEAWAREGLGYHQVLVYASLSTELDALCTLLDIEVVSLKGTRV